MYLPYFIGLLSESLHEDRDHFYFVLEYVPCAWNVTSVQVLNKNGNLDCYNPYSFKC